MDFSGGGLQGPLPPHLMGYSWGYLRPNNQPQGDWPIRFIPIEGTKQKVYQLRFDGLQTLLTGQTPYRYWYMKVPGNGQAYLFRFGDPAAAAVAQVRSQAILFSRLSAKDAEYSGYLSSSALGVFDAQKTAFKIHFTAFDQNSGRITADVGGVGEKEHFQMEGELSGRNVVLRRTGADTTWNLLATEDNMLRGSQQGGVAVTVAVEVNLTPPSSLPTTQGSPPDDMQRSQRAEARLNEAYSALKATLNDAEKAALKQEELQWLQGRDGVANDKPRWTEMTEERVKQLEERLKK
jgi:hypothetical protein